MALFDFRRYKKRQGNSYERHPKLIVDEKSTQYGYMGLTESKYKGKHHRNIPISNPKKGDNRPSYLRRKIEYDTKNNFGDVLVDYRLSDEDIDKIIKYLNKHVKK